MAVITIKGTASRVGRLFEATAGDHRVPMQNLLRVRDIFFEDFDPQLTYENQKFDFSFSSNPIDGFRFSYNDFAEKDRFQTKLNDCIQNFKSHYSMHLWGAILNTARRIGTLHQTTFGLEWLTEQPLPRFKLYFEELHHHYSETVRWRLARDIAETLQMPREIRKAGGTAPAAICVDFMPHGRQEMKCYTITRDATRLLSEMRCWGKYALRQWLLFQKTLRREKRAFFYFTRRTDQKGNLVSAKWYKIYEVRQMPDLGLALRETDELWKQIRPPSEAREKFLRHCQGLALFPLPVISAIDIRPNSECKVDLYYSVRSRL